MLSEACSLECGSDIPITLQHDNDCPNTSGATGKGLSDFYFCLVLKRDFKVTP